MYKNTPRKTQTETTKLEQTCHLPPAPFSSLGQHKLGQEAQFAMEGHHEAAKYALARPPPPGTCSWATDHKWPQHHSALADRKPQICRRQVNRRQTAGDVHGTAVTTKHVIK